MFEQLEESLRKLSSEQLEERLPERLSSMCMFSTSPLRQAIRSKDEAQVLAILQAAGQGAADLINEDYTSDCLFNPFMRNIRPALQSAVVMRHLGIVHCLLLHGADPDARGPFGESSLHVAARYGYLGEEDGGKGSTGMSNNMMAETATAHSSQANTKPSPALATAMTSATMSDSKSSGAIIVELVRVGRADVYARDSTGNVPLHTAIDPHFGASSHPSHHRLNIVRTLVEDVGSVQDLKLKNGAGRTPLHLAAMTGNTAVVTYLLQKGSDVNALDIDGKKPVDLAHHNVRDLFNLN